MDHMDENDRKPFDGCRFVARGIVPEGYTVAGDWLVPAPATAREVREAIQQSAAEVRQEVQQLRSEVLATRSTAEASPHSVVVGEGAAQPVMLDVKAAAALLGISVRSWQRLVERGEAPKPMKIGKSSRWRRSDVEAFVNSRR